MAGVEISHAQGLVSNLFLFQQYLAIIQPSIQDVAPLCHFCWPSQNLSHWHMCTFRLMLHKLLPDTEPAWQAQTCTHKDIHIHANIHTSTYSHMHTQKHTHDALWHHLPLCAARGHVHALNKNLHLYMPKCVHALNKHLHMPKCVHALNKHLHMPKCVHACMHTRMLCTHSTYVPSLAGRGLAYLALGMLLEAEEDFAEALRTAPSHAHYPHYRAVVHGRKVRSISLKAYV